MPSKTPNKPTKKVAPKKPAKKIIPKKPSKATEIDHMLERMLKCKPQKK